MILTAPAIVLAIHPWSKTSHMVTWLTDGYGKFLTPVKGACRPKSAFLGQYDLFYTCALSFYRRERDGVHAIRECAPLTFREKIRGHWRKTAIASAIASETAAIAIPPEESPLFFALLDTVLNQIEKAKTPNELRLIFLWYEIHLLKQLGLQPDFNRCPLCHTPGQAWFRFTPESGHFLCVHRPLRTTGESAVSVHGQVRKLYRRLFHSPAATLPILTEKWKENDFFEENPNPLLGLFRFLGIFMKLHLDLPPTVRRVSWEMTEQVLP